MLRTPLVLLLVGILNQGPSADLRIQGRIVDQGGLALPGVTLRLLPPSGAPAQTAITGADGTYEFFAQAGDYRLEAVLDGFQTLIRPVHASESVVLPDLVMNVAGFSEETTVVATLPTEVQPRQFGAPATIAEKVIDNAPLRSNRYDDMLPLLPNVVRGPDGLISVAGARAPQGVVLVNGVPSGDVASGAPVTSVPLGAVETVQVVSTGFAAEFGPSTGGVTVINSRTGSDAYKFAVNSFIPRLRLADGGVRGIEAWNPNSSLRGPIARGRAWFAQSLDYHWEKTRAETVLGTQDRRERGFTSFSQVDAKLTPANTITTWFSGHKTHVDAEHLAAFTPTGTVPSSDHTVWSGATIDRAAFGTSTLETRADVRHQDITLTPEGTDSYLVGHDVTRGSYFDTVNRHAISAEVASVFSRMSDGPLGRHLFKAGGSAGYRWLNGTEDSRPVTYLRSNMLPAMRVEFVGPGRFDADSGQVGAFAQDAWDVSDRVRLDLGFRMDHDSHVGTVAAPRVGLTWSVDDRTTVSAGAGYFTGDTPLAALAFDEYQARRITRYDESGAIIGTPITYRNVLDRNLGRTRARMWSARVDRRLSPGWQLRTSVQERRGTDEALVSPAIVDGEAAARLSTSGTSRTRSFEATLGYHPTGRQHQLYMSYVRSSSTGNTNDFGQVEGLFREARLDAAESAALPADVPHRLLVWGLFSLPARTTVAPFLDLRSGFPYSAVGDDWSYAEPRFSRRYPTFASLDLVINKIVTLPHGLRARVGLKLYNIAGRRNGRDVQADLSRDDFGRTYNALGRQFRGVFEIIWGAK